MAVDAATEVCEWLVALDEPGNEERRTVTLTRIIRRATSALGRAEGGTELLCVLCGLSVEPVAPNGFRILGFEVPRKDGGANVIHNRVPVHSAWAHEGCLKKAASVGMEQEVLL